MVLNCIDISKVNKDNYMIFKEKVSEEIIRKSERFIFPKDSYRCILGELLLKYSVYEATNKIFSLDISKNYYGKPFIRNIKGFNYNISHSGDWLVIAYGVCEVGVDIESVQNDMEGVIDSILTKTEKEYVYSFPVYERNRKRIQIWTLKESYIKYIGTGFSTDINSFSVNADNGGVITNNLQQISGIKLSCLTHRNDYYISVCSHDDNIVKKEISIKALIDFAARIDLI